MDASAYPYVQALMAGRRRRILLQYLLTVSAAVVFGWLLACFLKEDVLSSVRYQAAIHFELIFWGTDSVLDRAFLILRYALLDILCAVLTFLFSFTAPRCFITDLVLFFLGAHTGMSLSLLFQIEMGRTPPFANGGYLTVFFAFRLGILGLFLLFCWKETVCSAFFKGLPGKARALMGLAFLHAFFILLCTAGYTLLIDHFLNNI